MLLKLLKYSSCLTIVILVLYSFSFLFIPFLAVNRAYAAESISKDEVYKGIGIALFLILLSELGQARDAEPETDFKNEIDLGDVGKDEVTVLARAIYGEAEVSLIKVRLL